MYDDWPVTRSSNATINKEPKNPSVNFVPIGTTWGHRIITYFFQNGTNDIDTNTELQAIRDGFTFWANETDLAFLEVCNANEADFVILWGSFDHGDSVPFELLNVQRIFNI